MQLEQYGLLEDKLANHNPNRQGLPIHESERSIQFVLDNQVVQQVGFTSILR
jgi:hypothetical protein